MRIRVATAEDAAAVSALINASAHHFLQDPSGRGAERFLEGIAPEAVLGYINNPNFLYLIAETSGNLAGAAALRDRTHLFHLFVAPSYQRQGLARALWTAVRQGAGEGMGKFTVNSSPNAVAVYERFGFTSTGPHTKINGISYVPMKAVTRSQSVLP